jgi:hypothetical protein
LRDERQRAPARAGYCSRVDPAGALRSRDHLALLLRAHGLAEHAEQLANEVAEFGLRVLEGEGTERSRLGGPPLLPAGACWPRTSTGRPLVFLAGIDLGELPTFDCRDRWPAAGWLLFYADLELDERHRLYLEESGNADGERARVLYVAPEMDVGPAEPPGRTLQTRAVRLLPTMTLPALGPEGADGPTRGAALGLDAVAARKYERAVGALIEADPNDAWGGDDWPPQHWVGGQRVDYRPGSTQLLHLDSDPTLDFEFLAGGAIRFEIPTNDLRIAELARVTATGEPG